MPEIKPSANKLGCFLLKGDFCFNVVLLDSVYGKLAAVLDLPPIISSHFFPRVYLSSRRDASFPLRSIADTEAQTNKCAHMDPHMSYVHRRAYRASLFAERVLLTTTPTKGTHGF